MLEDALNCGAGVLKGVEPNLFMLCLILFCEAQGISTPNPAFWFLLWDHWPSFVIWPKAYSSKGPQSVAMGDTKQICPMDYVNF
jgi:hypothetical protein